MCEMIVWVFRLSAMAFLGLCAAVGLGSGCEPAKRNNESEDWAIQTLSGMTLEQKAAQMVCAEINGNYIADDDPRMLQWMALARDHGIGGFVVYGGTPHSIAVLLNKLQAAAEVPILISTDFEGGPGQQVLGASEFPPNMAFAATGDEDLMYRAARVMATEGKAMGIHLTYTPVVDISLSPFNPQESGRSFGGDLDLLGRMVNSYVKGFHEIGMLTTAKHFPGRGDMKGNPPYPSFTQLDKSAAELDSGEFKVFRLAIAAGVDFIMTEHIYVPSVTGGSTLPSSVEPRLIKGVIRERLGFEGIITSDDLWYDHVVAAYGKEEVAVKALEAGHDLVLKPKDPVATIGAIVEAVKSNRINMEQVDQSVLKLLRKKVQLGLHLNKIVSVDSINQSVGTAANKALVQEVADRSVTLLRNDGVLPLRSLSPSKTVHIVVQKDADMPQVGVLVRELNAAFAGITHYTLRPYMGDSYKSEILKASTEANLVLVSLFVQRDRHGDPAPVRAEDIALINDIIRRSPGKMVAISFGNPHLIRKLENVPAFLIGWGEGGFYGNQPVYFGSLIRILKNELQPAGKLPLKVSDEMPIGFGLTYPAGNLPK